MATAILTTRRLAALAGVLAAAACVEPVPTQAVGNWGTAAIPSGWQRTMSLQDSPTLANVFQSPLHGTGSEGGFPFGAPTLSFLINGTYEGGVLSLFITYESGAHASYTGALDGTDVLTGTWTDSANGSYALRFFRRPS